MKLTRLAATAAAAVLAATGLAAVSDLAQASTQHPGHFRVDYPFRLGQSRIQGTAVDQFGKRLDDVSVHASGANGSASQLTYAKGTGIGHGYFNLSVRRGTYTVTLNKKGYHSVTLEGVKVGRQDVVDLGKITLAKNLTKTETTLSKDKCKRKGGKLVCAVTVHVGGKGVRKPTGKVSIGELSHTLKPQDGGTWETTLVVARTKTFSASYAGDTHYAASKSNDLKIRV